MFLVIELVLGVLVGYTVGRVIWWIVRHYVRVEVSPFRYRLLWTILGALFVAITIIGIHQHNALSDMVHMPRLTTTQFVRTYLTTGVILAGLYLIARLWGRLFTALQQRFRWFAKAWWIAVSIIVLGLSALVLSGVFGNRLYQYYQGSYAAAQARTDEGISPTTDTLRSGSASSLVSWQNLGRQGRNFIGSGPDAVTISKVTHRSAKQPIRVYVGVESASTAAERARIAVQELERTDAFSRRILVVMTPSGSGWIEPELADSVEYVHGGDTAIVTTQYAYVPSWVVSTFKQDLATESGQALFAAIYAKWSTLPQEARPKLYVCGLSLGSYGMQAAFTSTSDVLQKTDGAMFSGTPSFTPLWSEVVSQRVQGSTMGAPRFPAASEVRFAANRTELSDPLSKNTRIIYTQHGSDPTVWWNPQTIFRKPTWMDEVRPSDQSPRMRWFPVVTFTKLTIDQFLGLDPEKGFGHNYQNTHTRAWLSLGVPDADWREDTTRAVEQQLGIKPDAP